MTVDRIVHAFAGAMVLASVLLAWLVSPWFLALTAFVGANLLQTAFTRFCPLAWILRRAGVRDPVPEDARSL
jgi:hypothetical protein